MDNLYVTVNKIVLFCGIAPENSAVEEEGAPEELALSFWPTSGVKSTLHLDQ
ncbi:hypothetical protein LEMLEM_LOCUS6870, partial [Lemmus lemmus]